MRIDDLERELRAERPEPSIEFARRLDEWADAGFPRDSGLGPRTGARRGALRRTWDRLTAAPARGVLLQAGAVAAAGVVVGVVVGRSGSDEAGVSTTQPAPTSAESQVPEAQSQFQRSAPPAGAESNSAAPSTDELP